MAKGIGVVAVRRLHCRSTWRAALGAKFDILMMKRAVDVKKWELRFDGAKDKIDKVRIAHVIYLT